VPLTRSSAASIDAPRPQLRPGATVRLLTADQLGEVATVRAMPTFPRRVASGVQTLAVEVVRTDGGTLWLPRTCVEVLN
jgi:hypothetical protein